MAAALTVTWIRLVPLSLRSLNDEAAARVSSEHAQPIQIPSAMKEFRRETERNRLPAQGRAYHPGEFESARRSIAAQMRSQFSYLASDGAQHVFLGDADSYHWLRMARNYLRTGTTCDAVVNGQCRDSYANAPVGRRNVYSRSLHIVAIVGVQRLLNVINPGYPLAASSFLVPVIVGMFGVFPAYALGRRFGGELGGLAAALMSGLNPLFLVRSMGSDDDVWNVVLPLFIVWIAVEALYASQTRSRVCCAVVAAVFTGLQAAVWSGWPFIYGVVLAGLLVNLAVESVRFLIARLAERDAPSDPVRDAATVAAVYCLSSGVFTGFAGAESFIGLPIDLLRPLVGAFVRHPVAQSADSLVWPDVFSTVAELAVPNLSAIANLMGAPVLFFTSWLGLLIMLLPKSGWKTQHFILLIGGTYLYWYLLIAPLLGRVSLLVILAGPLAMAILIEFFPEGGGNVGGGMLLILWFLSALFMSYQAVRLAMLLVPPFAIAFGAAIGRVHEWLDRQVESLMPGTEQFTRPATFALVAAVLIIPVWEGYAVASSYLPVIDNAWYGALTDLRVKSPADSIVNTWWDYGYWTKYFAERRVNADGGSLATHIPYWTARALAAPTDRESAGLLRMIDCGTDATPQPEGREGAYGKLRSYRIDEFRAVDIVDNLARMGRTEARAYLASQNLGLAAQNEILRSTHCDPPPAFLLLDSKASALGGLWFIANWDFPRAYMLRRGRALPESVASSEMVAQFGYAADDAHSLYENARALKSKNDKTGFVAPSSLTVAPRWIQCRSAGSNLICNSDLTIGPEGIVRKISYDASDPTQSRLLLVDSRGLSNEEVPPAAVIIGQPDGIKDLMISSAPYPSLGLLVDAAHARVIVASPGLLRSTYSKLAYLNDSTGKFFTKVDDQTGFWDEHVTVWKINWDSLRQEDPD